ncbi:MAG TPA: hypothetical protein VHW93_04525 [Acidimicrobiales bacterium]|nr:hypothetical protein [Acidimicrobiales bacterium]
MSAVQTERALDLSRTMNQIAAAIRQARTDASASPQAVKDLLNAYCATEAELRSLVTPVIKPLW